MTILSFSNIKLWVQNKMSTGVGANARNEWFPYEKYASAEWTKQRVKMELPSRSGLGIICMSPLCEGLILLEHVSKVLTWG